MTFLKMLESKPLFSSTFDKTRMPRVYAKIASQIKLPSTIVHIIGTNGKGTTGRFLALMLKDLGVKAGHYTSPHINIVNERFWIDGNYVDDEILEEKHIFLEKIISKKDLNELSYFEYLTFLAPLVFNECEVLILEAGLGGEFDATNIFPKNLSIITPIGLDHEHVLGNKLEEIAKTKIRSISATTLVSNNQDPKVKKIVKGIAHERELPLLYTKDLVSSKTLKDIDLYKKRFLYPDFLKMNLQTAYAAMRILGFNPKINSLSALDLRGRFEFYRKNVLLDCGHNPMAAKALYEALPDEKHILVYNAYEDKDVKKVLKVLAPKLKSIKIMPLKPAQRKDSKESIVKIAKELGLKVDIFDFKMNPEEFYVVFGSFAVVEGFLKEMNAQ